MVRVSADTIVVPVYPGLFQRVRQLRLLSEYRAYSTIKSLDHENNGVVPWAEVFGLLLEFMSPSSVYRVLKNGEGTFWDTRVGRRGKALWLKGAVKLTELLDPPNLSSRRVFVPLEGLKDRGWRAILHASELRVFTRPDQPVSRKTLRRRTGVSEASQRRHCESVLIKRGHNYATDQRTCRIHSELHLTDQLPNTYAVALDANRSGQLKLLNRHNNRRNAVLESVPSSKGKPYYVRLSKKAGNRVVRAVRQGYLPVYISLHSNGGIVSWESSHNLGPIPKSDRHNGQGGMGFGISVETGRPRAIRKVARAPNFKTAQVTPVEVLNRIQRWPDVEVKWLFDRGSGVCLCCAKIVARGVMISGASDCWYVHADCLKPKVAERLQQLVKRS